MTMTPGDAPLTDTAIDALLAGRGATADPDLARTLGLLRALGAGQAPKPSLALATAFEQGLTVPTRGPAPIPANRRWRTSGRIAAIVTMLSASLVGAAAANALPPGAQTAVRTVVEALTPLTLPRPHAQIHPQPPATPDAATPGMSPTPNAAEPARPTAIGDPQGTQGSPQPLTPGTTPAPASNPAISGEGDGNGAATNESDSNGAATNESDSNGAATNESDSNGAATNESDSSGAVSRESDSSGAVSRESDSSGAVSRERGGISLRKSGRTSGADADPAPATDASDGSGDTSPIDGAVNSGAGPTDGASPTDGGSSSDAG